MIDRPRVLLRRRWEHRAYPQIVGTFSLRLARLLERFRRNADDGLVAKRTTRLSTGDIILSDMHAICTNAQSELDIVIDQKRYASLCAQRLRLARKRLFLFRRGVFFTKLNTGDPACRKSLLQDLPEATPPKP